jgi:hypothetical protein
MRSFMHVNRLGRGLLTAVIAAAVAFGMTASIAAPADAVRTKNRKSTPGPFSGPAKFKCYWIEPLHQYGCDDLSVPAGEVRSVNAFFLNVALAPGGNGTDNPKRDDEFATPGSFRCDLTGSDTTDPADYSCAYKYRQGKRTFHFTLNEALLFTVTDTENPQVNFDTWFLPRPVRR